MRTDLSVVLLPTGSHCEIGRIEDTVRVEGKDLPERGPGARQPVDEAVGFGAQGTDVIMPEQAGWVEQHSEASVREKVGRGHRRGFRTEIPSRRLRSNRPGRL